VDLENQRSVIKKNQENRKWPAHLVFLNLMEQANQSFAVAAALTGMPAAAGPRPAEPG